MSQKAFLVLGNIYEISGITRFLVIHGTGLFHLIEFVMEAASTRLAMFPLI